jgi:Fic family protein
MPKESVSYQWKPIEPLGEAEKSIDLSKTNNLIQAWLEIQNQWKQESLLEFREQLIRRLSIETGIIERLYDLNAGATETLVTQGFAAELLRHSDTNIDATTLVEILQNHKSTIDLLMDGIGQQRPLSKSFIHELHQILTQNQNDVDAVDQFGQRRKVPLLKGQYKKMPNNPTRRDGHIHEYAPPVQVESEMENLLEWLSGYENENPLSVAAWLHHRFAQIHPYQDGNGRLARTLMTYVLLKAKLLPIVIQGDENNRNQYIRALEQADAGNLEPLIQLLAHLQETAILQAMSFEGAQKPLVTETVIASLKNKLQKLTAESENQLRQTNALAISLRGYAQELASTLIKPLEVGLSRQNQPIKSSFIGGADQNTRHWYRHQTLKMANQSKTVVNFNENRYFLKFSVQIQSEELNFVVIWYHIGRELSGVMQADAFAELETIQDDATKQFIPCSMTPFVFTHNSQFEKERNLFSQWFDLAFAVGMKAFSERL